MDTNPHFVESGDGGAVLLERRVLLEQFEGFLVHGLEADEDHGTVGALHQTE